MSILEWHLKFYGLNKTCAMHILVSLRAKDKQETATLPSLNVSVTGLIHSCSSSPSSLANTWTVAVLPAPAGPVRSNKALEC